MDVTFRLRRSHRDQGIWCLSLFLAWAGLGLFVTLRTPDAPDPLALAALMAGVPLLMAGGAIVMLAAYWREELKIRNERLTFRGIVRRKDIDLRDVTDARWQTSGSSLALRADSVRHTIHFANYNDDESVWIVHHMRSVLRPEIQSGWNLFAVKSAFLKPKTARLKPGPDEIVIHRDRWNWFFAPSFVLMVPVAIVSWRATGNLVCLLALLFPIGMWAWIRALTPTEGTVYKKVVSSEHPEVNRFLLFLLLWGIVAVAGVFAHEHYRPGKTQLDAFQIVGAAVWAGVLLVEAGLAVSRQRRRDCEAADRAAKGRGEAIADPWQTE